MNHILSKMCTNVLPPLTQRDHILRVSSYFFPFPFLRNIISLLIMFDCLIISFFSFFVTLLYMVTIFILVTNLFLSVYFLPFFVLCNFVVNIQIVSFSLSLVVSFFVSFCVSYFHQ